MRHLVYEGHPWSCEQQVRSELPKADEVRMLTFIVGRFLSSVPVVKVASVLVLFFVHATTYPLARFRTRDPNTRTEAGLRIGVLEKPCTKIGPDTNILKCTDT